MKLTRHLAVGLLVLAIGAAATFAYFGKREVAPDVAFTLMDGTPSHIGKLQGKVVLVSFWATTCPICIKEMPQMIATHEKFSGRGFETLAVAMSYDPPISVINFTDARKLPFTVVLDNTGSMAHSFGDVQATPTLVLINKRGEIVERYVGAPDFGALQRRVEALLVEV